MPTLPIYNTEGKEVDSVKLDPFIFEGEVNTKAIYQAVCAFRANQRLGLAQVKTRGEVSGGGKKPWRQKGTGRARHGSIRSPLWRHGGVTFGPVSRDFSYSLPNKIKLVALKSALRAKVQANNLTVIDDFRMQEPKTKQAAKVFLNLKIDAVKTAKGRPEARRGSVLLLLDKMDDKLKLALRNIDFVDACLARDVNAYQVLTHRRIAFTKKALGDLQERFKVLKAGKVSGKEKKE